jgi:hypothetical protein
LQGFRLTGLGGLGQEDGIKYTDIEREKGCLAMKKGLSRHTHTRNHDYNTTNGFRIALPKKKKEEDIRDIIRTSATSLYVITYELLRRSIINDPI